MTFLFQVVFLIFQQDHWVKSIAHEPEDLPQEVIENRKKIAIPIIVFLTKIWLQVVMLTAYQASYNEDIIFPFYKRATAIGIANFFARSFTIGSPLVAELDKPVPTIILLCAVFLALVSSFFLPSRQEERELEERK